MFGYVTTKNKTCMHTLTKKTQLPKLLALLTITLFIGSLLWAKQSAITDEEHPVVVDAFTGATETQSHPEFLYKSTPPPIWSKWLKDRDGLKAPGQSATLYYSASYELQELSRSSLNTISDAYGFPRDLLYYQNHVESRGACPKKPNNKGASGCFQFLRATAKEFSLISDNGDYRHVPLASADAAARYMLWLTIVMYGDKADPGDWEQLRHVLAAYNAGYSKVIKTGTIRIPNFYETVRYVQQIEDLVKGRSVVVSRGDTLEKLSAKTTVPIKHILQGNTSVTGNHDLEAGDVLSLPDENGMSKVVIRRGMSLYAIQKKTGVPISDLIRVNQLTDKDLIRVADVIKIPATI